MKKRDNKGFTLVELLATIAILGILGIVAVTATVRYLNSSREKSYIMMSQALFESGQNCVIQNKCSKNTNVPSKTLQEKGYIENLKNPISGNKDCTGTVEIPNDPISGDYVVDLECEGRKGILRIVWPDKNIYNINAYNENESLINKYIVAAYNYNAKTCPTGDEGSCVKTTCYENTNANSCSTGTIIKYKVNDSDVKTFYVINDEGPTLTMISKDSAKSSYNDDYTYLDSSNGPSTATATVNNMANGWTNVNEHNYQTSSTGYSLEDGYPAIMDIWSGETKTARARLLTGGEADSLGCFSGNCPKYISTWLGDFTYSSVEFCYYMSSGPYGTCQSWRTMYNSGYPIAIIPSYGYDTLDSTYKSNVQAVIKVNKNNE